MNVKPIGDRVLIQPKKAAEKSSGGIILPETTKKKTDTGTVKVVGDDKDKIKVAVGEVVMYDIYAGTPIKVDGEDHLLIKAADIIAVVEE